LLVELQACLTVQRNISFYNDQVICDILPAHPSVLTNGLIKMERQEGWGRDEASSVK